MSHLNSEAWLAVMRDTVSSYRRMIDETIEQLTDVELFTRPDPEVNSVAVLLRHLGGNLRSRWTDFQTTDGEKTDRDRDSEFVDWDGSRQSLMEHFNGGWRCLEVALETIDDETAGQTVYIRGEPHSVAQALVRSIAHITYHVGQIALISRTVHRGQWRWLTVAPGESTSHNKDTWGTAASRGVLSTRKDA